MARNDPAVGISISDNTLRSLAIDSVSLEPIAAAEMVLSGELSDSMRASLRELRVRPATVTAAFGLDRATVRRMTLPQTSDQNVDRMVRFEAERYIPLPLEAVELDYVVATDRGADRLEVVVAAVRKDDAMQLHRALSEATGAATVLDAEGTALLAAWHQARGDVGEAVLLVDLSGQSASLVVCESGSLGLARSAPTGVDALRQALAEDLRITAAEAEDVRRSQGVTGLETGPPDLPASEEPLDRELTTSWLTRLSQEIRRTLESFRTQRGGMQSCAVALTGEGADTPGLIDALQEATGQAIDIFDPLAGTSIALPAPGHHFTLAYGLALRSADRSPVTIDLSPRAERVGRRRRRERTGWVAAAVAVVIAVAAAYLYVSTRVAEIETEARRVREQVKHLESQVGDVDTALAAAAVVGEMDDLLAQLEQPEARPLEVLHGVSLSVPGGLWLTDFLYDRDRGISLHGNALDSVAITETVRVLSRKPYLEQVKLSSINIITIGDRQVYEFDITADFPQPEESEE